MQDFSSDGFNSIVHLPDDCLSNIFRLLTCSSDRESFGLTCHRWLNIQNTSRRSLHLDYSLGLLNFASSSQSSFDVNSYHLHRLLARFRHLQYLSLSGCTELPDSGLTQLQVYAAELHSLHLDYCFSITDYGLSLVAKGCPSLTVISLYHCNITDFGLETLAKGCTKLKHVNLAYCLLVSDSGLQAIIETCYELKAVKISFCEGICGTGFRGCSPTLASIDAESCKLRPEGIVGIVSGGGLEHLNISNINCLINGDWLAAIGTGFAARLKILNLRTCRNFGDKSVAAIAKGCPLLREWNLALCHGIRVSGWKSIAMNCNNLEILHVNRCRNLSDLGLQALKEGCKRLHVLHISHCFRLSPNAMELFKLQRGDVEIKAEEAMCVGPDWADDIKMDEGNFKHS